MNILRADLGFLPQSSRVTVELSAPANVRLMVAECAVLSQFGYPYVFCGGLYPRGRVEITVPDDDHWVLIVDLEGLAWPVTVSPVQSRDRRSGRLAMPSSARRSCAGGALTQAEWASSLATRPHPFRGASIWLRGRTVDELLSAPSEL